ncbi:SusC/RagA family TonB-linked outer membrane protein [Sphingobacterium sp.]|uniref:SusC/RagA family TonB-linked outer membrane protein n=1 Tax=Sphingobacterium sp. TaxID=341027 RepID=UPI0031D2E241
MNTHFLRWIRRPSRMLPLALIVSSLGPVQIAHAQIKLAKEKKTLTEYFREIEKQTGYIFLYDQSVSAVIKISLDCSDCNIQQLIAEMAKKSDLEFKISGKQILVKKHKKGAVESKQAIPMTKLDTLVGTVIDIHGTPIQGTTIQVKGTKIGTSSDRMGMFKLQKPVKGAVLVAHAIGYEPQEIEIDGQNTVAMRLLSKSILVDEVVVSTGFQKRQRNKMIGNVSSITGADMEMAGVTSVDKALRGKLTGVYVNANSGRPGETGKIMIRGNNTMTGNGEPLFVLDGMPLQTGDVAGIGSNNNINSLLTNGVGNIPPEDIASIDILRDATAAAIYGARAANGVIVITTKRGQAGKDYIAYTGRAALVAPPTNHFNFMNSEQKLNYERNLYNDFHPAYGGRANQLLLQAENGTISLEEADRQIAELGKTNTNWIDQLYRPALQQTHNITLSGGNTQTQYNVSLNHQDAQGTLIENKFRMSNMNMKLSRNIQDKLLIDLNMYGTLKKNQEGVSNLDPFRYAVFANPYERPYDDQGNYAWDMTYRNLSTNLNNDNPLNYQTFNIIRELRENRMTTDYGNIRATLGLEYKFLKNFRYRANAAIDYTSVTTEDESRAGTYRSFAENWIAKASNLDGTILDKYNLGFFKENSGKTIAYTVRNTVEYNQTFSNKHFIQAFVANEISDKINKRFNHNNPIYLQDYRMTGYPSWDVIPKEVYNRLQLETLGGTYFEEDREVSFISSLVYAYDNRYVVNANFRSDGVDIIGSKNQFTPLWSAGLKWNAHEEDFIKNRFAWLNRFVVSAGYGYTGSINRSIYPFHTYTLSAQMYGNVVTASQFNFGNPVLKWEKKRDLDLGVQLSMLNSRLNMEANYYDNKVTDLLDEIELPISVGRASAKVNNGILTNKGWELSARIEVVKIQTGSGKSEQT